MPPLFSLFPSAILGQVAVSVLPDDGMLTFSNRGGQPGSQGQMKWPGELGT